MLPETDLRPDCFLVLKESLTLHHVVVKTLSNTHTFVIGNHGNLRCCNGFQLNIISKPPEALICKTGNGVLHYGGILGIIYLKCDTHPCDLAYNTTWLVLTLRDVVIPMIGVRHFGNL